MSLRSPRPLVVLLFLLTAPFSARATPRTPSDGAEVLERLRQGPADARERRLRALREQLSSHPDDLPAALEAARLALELARATSDPRWLGRAQSALGPWWSAEHPPEPVRVLRATIRQSSHEFAPAAQDLEQALREDPKDAQAWLTLAAVEQVRGQLVKARKACAPLWRLAPRPIAATCLAQAMSLSGELAKSRALLEQITAADGAVDKGQALWTETALAEMAVRAGDLAAAELRFQRALVLDPNDPYLLGAWSDYLLDRGRFAEVAALLRERTRADGLLLRLAIADRALGAPQAGADERMLADRFAASRLRGDVVHRREQSRFELLRGDPKAALQLAADNFAVQREPADLRIYLEAAVAAGDRAAAAPALDFLAATKLEDATLAPLAARLEERR